MCFSYSGTDGVHISNSITLGQNVFTFLAKTRNRLDYVLLHVLKEMLYVSLEQDRRGKEDVGLLLLLLLYTCDDFCKLQRAMSGTIF